MTDSLFYGPYTPDRISIDNLGINLTPATNASLSFNSEYLIVGEATSSSGSSTNNSLSLIVDSRGIATNMNLSNRRQRSEYHNEFVGNTFIRGNLHVSGTIFSNNDTIIGTGGSASGIFNYAYDNIGIYYDGQTTFGNIDSATNNTYVVNISKAIDRNMDKAQFVIQNNRSAVGKVAIIGNSIFSPLIFNTSSNVPIEFHIGRTNEYFSNAYKKIDYVNGIARIIDSDTPEYNGRNNSPHFNIDVNGNVGVKTSVNKLIRYNIRQTNEYGGVNYTSNIAYPDFFVNGTMFSSNILMFDYETNTHRNLDELYARREGQSIDISALIPGKFSKGYYEFQSNVSIMGNIDPDYELKVYGNIGLTGDLSVDCNATIRKELSTRTLHVHERATFSNNLFIQDNIYVKNNIYQYKHTLNDIDYYEVLSLVSNVINLENGARTDFTYYRNGYSTKRRFGVGIQLDMSDEVNNQLVVSKRDKTIFELELSDVNIAGFKKALYVGHPNTSYANRADGSVVFITPGPDNRAHHVSQTVPQQNIYFYPGYNDPISDFSLNSNNPPTLGLFFNNKVGINTFSPEFELDVVGDIAISGNYYLKKEGFRDPIKLGIWNERDGGIFYYNESSPHVGINTVPQDEYGLTVTGKILSIDGYFTVHGFRMIPLYNSRDAQSIPSPVYEYAYFRGCLGIGDFNRPLDANDTPGTLSIRETFETYNTTVKIKNSAAGQESSLHFIGNANQYIQLMNDTNGTFELYNGTHISMRNLNTARAFITKKYENGFNQFILNSNLAYGLQKTDCALLVNGNVDVKGSINVSGEYKVSGRIIEINAGGTAADYYNVPNTAENIYMTASNIYLNPHSLTGGACYIGWGNDIASAGNNALINILLRTSTASLNPSLIFICRFASRNSTSALTQYQNNNQNTAVIGINNSDFYIGETRSTKPYIVVKDMGDLTQTINYTSMGIGTATPDRSKIHVYTNISSVQPLATFTRASTGDGDTTYADIILEKKINNLATYQWKIQGPVLHGNTQKLQFLYKDNTDPDAQERFCITSNGNIGINTSFPTHVLDVRGESIRIHNDEPRLVFQKGTSAYGTSIVNDYSIYSSNNTFAIESRDVFRGKQTILHVSSNNAVGINMLADPLYDVSIYGTLNVTEKIFIQGKPFFSVLDNTTVNGSFLEWENIFLNPNATVFGGVYINGGTVPTSNIFQVNSGKNGNVAVLNSMYSQSLLHFRNLHRRTELEEYEKIWRVGSSNNSFIIEHRSNVIYDELVITDDTTHYGRVVEYIQSDVIGEFIERLNGSIELDAINPELTMNGINVLGTSNDNMYIMTSNLGIGTIMPDARVHIHNTSPVDSFKITDAFVITSNGDVGIGTMIPETNVHIIGSAKFENTMEVVGSSIFRNNITVKGNIVNDSDARMKTDIVKIENALAKIEKISGYTFTKNGRKETGVIAQEIYDVLPEAVFDNKDGMMGVAYGNIIGLLIEGIKELHISIKDLKSALNK